MHDILNSILQWNCSRISDLVMYSFEWWKDEHTANTSRQGTNWNRKGVIVRACGKKILKPQPKKINNNRADGSKHWKGI